MNQSYVIEQLPLASQLARLLDWALIIQVLVAGVALYFAWRGVRLSARIRELEATLEAMSPSTQSETSSERLVTLSSSEKTSYVSSTETQQ